MHPYPGMRLVPRALLLLLVPAIISSSFVALHREPFHKAESRAVPFNTQPPLAVCQHASQHTGMQKLVTHTILERYLEIDSNRPLKAAISPQGTRRLVRRAHTSTRFLLLGIGLPLGGGGLSTNAYQVHGDKRNREDVGSRRRGGCHRCTHSSAQTGRYAWKSVDTAFDFHHVDLAQ